MHLIKLPSLALIFTVFFTNPVYSVTFNESTDGDIDSYEAFFLTNGFNSFSGTVSHNSLDYDNLVFVVPEGTTAQFSFTYEFDTAFIVSSYNWVMEKLDTPTSAPCGIFLCDTVFASQQYGSPTGLAINSTYSFDTMPPLSSGAYYLGVVGGAVGQIDSIMSYQSNIIVSPIPIAPAWLLMLSGLFTLGVLRKKCITSASR